jgi:ER membrane protein complex subunit 7
MQRVSCLEEKDDEQSSSWVVGYHVRRQILGPTYLGLLIRYCLAEGRYNLVSQAMRLPSLPSCDSLLHTQRQANMMLPIASVAVLLYLCSLATAASLRVQIPASNVLSNPNTLPASTHATLTSGSGPVQRAVLRKGNYLLFDDVPTTGSHLLQVHSHSYTFAPYRIDISTDHKIVLAAETYPGVQWSDHGVNFAPNPAEHVTLNAKCLSKKEFYEIRQGFSPLSLLKNPMILMGGVALLFTFGMPKLMENMDPEMKAEYEEMQKSSSVGAVSRAMQGQGGGVEGFDLAGFLAGRSTTGSSTGGGEGIRERKK